MHYHSLYQVSILFDDCVKSELVSLIGEEKTATQKGIFPEIMPTVYTWNVYALLLIGILEDMCRGLVELIPVLSDIATSTLVQQSVRNLDPVQTIPRLYRRTNREVCMLGG